MKKNDLKRMSKQDREKKIKELKMEQIKLGTGSSKSSGTKAKEIKKTIARIITLNKSEEEELKKK